MDPLDPRRFPWADTPPDSRVWTLLPNQERIGVSPPPRPFPGPGSVPRAGLAASSPAKGPGELEVTRAAAEMPGWERRLRVRGGGGSPFSSLLRAPSSGARRIFTPESAPRHLPWASSAERQSRAAPPRPDILGAMAEAGAGRGRGGNSRRRLGPSWARSHPTQGGCGARMSLLKLWGPGSAIRGHFEGRGRPRRRRLHPWSW